MAILIITFSLGLFSAWALVYFTGLAAISPWFYLLIPVFGFFTSAIIISILWIGFLLTALPYRKVKCAGKGNMYYQFFSFYWAKLLLVGTWSRLKYHNFNKIPKKEPCLYIFNHTSFVDCWMLIASIHPHKFSIVALEAMKKVPFMGDLATALGCIFFNKDDHESSVKMIDNAVDYIKNQKTSIAISPEGRVNRENHVLNFKNGPFTIAKRSNCPIVLLDFKGIGGIDRRKNMFTKVPVETRVIKVVYPETYQDMSTKQLAEFCQHIYEDYMRESK